MKDQDSGLQKIIFLYNRNVSILLLQIFFNSYNKTLHDLKDSVLINFYKLTVGHYLSQGNDLSFYMYS